MVTTRRRATASIANTTASPKRRSKGDPGEERWRSPSPIGTTMVADAGYEEMREARIRENLERMQKLGIMDLSLQLKRSQQLHSHRRGATTTSTSPRSPADPSKALSPSLPKRRSSRLQNVAPVSYSEDPAGKADDEKARKRSVLIEEGQKEEVYTEEHEKLLGTCETAWTLFVDGYGSDGKRVYDQITGKTCHQCRQKTLGHRTHCIKCNLVQGQFCGDCLYMRYGENVLEVKKNPDWICPVCRGICNCSLCRLKKGWVPTGALYKKVSSLGFKSVAHYLVQTRRLQSNSGAQKSLPFTDADVSPQLNSSLKPGNGLNSVPCDKENNECNVKCSSPSADELAVGNVAVENTAMLKEKIKQEKDELAIGNVAAENTAMLKEKIKQEKDELAVGNVAAENTAMLKEKIKQEKDEPGETAKPSPDSVASRLRKRHKG